MTEEEVKTRLITPALTRAGWSLDSIKQERLIRFDQFFTDGKMILGQQKPYRAKPRKYDYCLHYIDGLPLAIIEAKADHKPLGEGMAQAMEYAKMMGIPFAYASNGSGFLEYDSFSGSQRELKEFPSPDELYARYLKGSGIDPQNSAFICAKYDLSQKTPRYYQSAAINATAAAIAKGQKRALIVMATGTGKTLVAYQIAKRFFDAFKAKNKKEPRILYLADRNILLDQAMAEFARFGGARHQIQNHRINPAFQIYFALYHQFISYETNIVDNQKELTTTRHFTEFASDFFDMVMIDECHRGSADEDAAWREILDYFSGAIHIGMTATPKLENGEGANLEYFGSPVYSYGLKDGINDGFLAPFLIYKYRINTEIDGYRVSIGETGENGEPLWPYYEASDINRKIIIKKRTELVAKTISDFMKSIGDIYAKTIVFCENQELALDMRMELANQNKEQMKQSSDFVVRITSSEDATTKELNLERFTSIKQAFPVIATTSELLSTGVDTKMVKIIAIDKHLGDNQKTLFKQIIGRGTRLNNTIQNAGKTHFYILDFTNASRLFDADEVEILPTEPTYKPKSGFEHTTITQAPLPLEPPIDEPPTKRVKIEGKDIFLAYKTEQILDENGHLISSNFTDFSRQNLRGKYANLADFLAAWDKEQRKSRILAELENHGVLIDELKIKDEFKNLDEFDILCQIAYDIPAISRRERAKKADKILEQYSGKAKKILDALLEKYAQFGVGVFEGSEIYKTAPFSTDLGVDFNAIISEFGDINTYASLMSDIKTQIYSRI